MDVVLCNPPFGARTLEKRAKVLRRYDLGHEWEVDEEGRWKKTRKLLPSQQLGILFIERSVRMLSAGGRLAIILPEGYLCSAGYGYVRQWMADNMQLLSLVELPRRIFVKSDADLRSNVVVGVRRSPRQLAKLVADNYPIYTGMVRRVGYKLGKGFGPLNERHPETGEQVRDGDNKPLLASDFRGVLAGFEAFGVGVLADPSQPWRGARIRDILSHANLDLKPRRLMPRALENINSIRTSPHVRLGDVAVVLRQTQDVLANPGPSGQRRLIEGQDIRAIEGTVVPQEPQRCWAIAERKAQNVYEVNDRDVVIGLVRPERRNIGMVVGIGSDTVATPDGVAIVRSRPEKANEYPQAWLLAALRSEACRLQFWTESGGTSYGKLTLDQIEAALLPDPGQEERHATADSVDTWAAGIEGALVALGSIGDEADRKPILNSPLFGLVDDAEVIGFNEID